MLPVKDGPKGFFVTSKAKLLTGTGVCRRALLIILNVMFLLHIKYFLKVQKRDVNMHYIKDKIKQHVREVLKTFYILHPPVFVFT